MDDGQGEEAEQVLGDDKVDLLTRSCFVLLLCSVLCFCAVLLPLQLLLVGTLAWPRAAGFQGGWLP